MIHKGIVTRHCFNILFNQSESLNHVQGTLASEDIRNFLIAFQLATEIQNSESLYIPSLIPHINEEPVKARVAEISKSKAARGFYYSFEKCDEVFALFSKLLCRLASKKYFYKMKEPGITFRKGFSAKIENRKLGTVAAMTGHLKWSDQEHTDEVEFSVAERDCNELKMDRPFGIHKVYILILFVGLNSY